LPGKSRGLFYDAGMLIRLLIALPFLLIASGSQAQAPTEPAPPSITVTPAPVSPYVIEWEVKGRFRLFRYEEDFERIARAHLEEGSILKAEQRLAMMSGGDGWAAELVDGKLCFDAYTNQLTRTCRRGPAKAADQENENYLTPQSHRVRFTLKDAPAAANCIWRFEDTAGTTDIPETACASSVIARIKYGQPTTARVEVKIPEQPSFVTSLEMQVRDLLIAGLGDSIASGEGNPDRAIEIGNQGLCFRRLGGEYNFYRPVRRGFVGNHSCEDDGNAATDRDNWLRIHSEWKSPACHRSLYSYQMRTALALAIQDPHTAVTFIPLGCSGATIASGLLGAQKARERFSDEKGRWTPGNVPAQLDQLRDLMRAAQATDKERKLDLVLLTIGANDVGFSELVADVIVSSATERKRLGSMISSVKQARGYLRDLPKNFVQLRQRLSPFVGGKLERVVFTGYANMAFKNGGELCGANSPGFDIHPAFGVDAKKLSETWDFLKTETIPRLKELATCSADGVCANRASDTMTFVDEHQAAFENHGFCAASENDPAFDRECFLADGKSFEDDPQAAAQAPLKCGRSTEEFKPYFPRARWIRTPNDSYFSAMTYPDGLSTFLQPLTIHDAVWGITSAVYGGALHPTAEGHAAMADAALKAAKMVLEKKD
jgi:hypothetical protein